MIQPIFPTVWLDYPLDVTLLTRCSYPEQTLRENIHHLVSQLEVFRQISKHHAERNQIKIKKRFDKKGTRCNFSSWRHCLDLYPCITKWTITQALNILGWTLPVAVL